MNDFLNQIAPIWTPHPGQRLFLEHPAKFKVLACGRRWGKTEACAVQIVAAMHRDSPTEHLILAPTLEQARLLFDRVEEMLRALDPAHELKVRSSPHPRLTFGPHRLTARSGHVPRSLRGLEATHIVIDEAAYLPESVITEVAMPMLATTDGSLTLISTPHGRNHFWRFHQMGLRGEHGIWSRSAPSAENPHVSPAFLQVQRELVSERAYRVEYEAAFEDSLSRVFRQEVIDAALVPALPLPHPAGPVCIGVDWARWSDFTAVAVVQGSREGAHLLSLSRSQGRSWAEMVRSVAEQIEAHPGARVVCDASGLGDPLLESLKERLPLHRVDGLVMTAANKAPLLDALAWQMEKRALLMTPHPELQREMEHFEQSRSDSGHVRMAAAGSGHDDLVIALSLAASALPHRIAGIPLLGAARRFSRNRTHRTSCRSFN